MCQHFPHHLKAFTFQKQSSISGRRRGSKKDQQPGGIDEWRLGRKRGEKRLLECSFIWTSHPDKAIRGSLSFHHLSKEGKRLKEREQKDKGEWAENDKDFREDLWGNYHLEHKEAVLWRIYEQVFSFQCGSFCHSLWNGRKGLLLHPKGLSSSVLKCICICSLSITAWSLVI